MPAWLYMLGPLGDGEPGFGAVPGRMDCVNERAEVDRAVVGRTAECALSSVVASSDPELRRMCGGPSPLGDCGDMVTVLSECMQRGNGSMQAICCSDAGARAY
jgi:hypothetical protein